MKIGVFAALGFLATLTVGSANAADPFASTPGVWDWNGPYFGVNGGGSWGTSRWTSGPVTTGDFNIAGGVAGATVGYDWQRGHLVYGILGDVDWAWLSGSTLTNCPPNCTTKDQVIGTVRARFGYEFGPWLPYLTGGAAIGDVRASFSPPVTGTVDQTTVGYAVGLGGEYQFAHHWSWWIEYLFEDLGSATCSTAVCHGPPAPSAVRFATSTVRVGLNRRF